MASIFDIKKRAVEFFEGDVMSWWNEVVCKLDAARQRNITPLLLSAIYLSLLRLIEAQSFGATYFNITPLKLIGGADAVKILNRQDQGRLRKVTLWFDAATGGPLPTIRIGTGPTSTNGGGIRVLPGQANLIGEVPPDAVLFAASTADITCYVMEVG